MSKGFYIVAIVAAVIVILIAVVLIFRKINSTSSYYRKQISRKDNAYSVSDIDLISEEDLSHLPGPVRRYLQYAGVVGTEKVRKIHMKANGEMRLDREKNWAAVDVDQISYFDEMTRLFYITMNFKGIDIAGVHHYEEAKAIMKIKLLDLFTVADAAGPEMDMGETVTVFNDICILAPSKLIEDNIRWEEIDDHRAKAYYTNKDITVSAILFFNDEGRLIDFHSEDRYHFNSDGSYSRIPWSTPIGEYRNINGLNLPSYAEAVWHYDEGDFSYARFNIVDLEVNPR